MNKRTIEEAIFKLLMIFSISIVVGSLIIIIALVIINGSPALTLELLTQTSSGEFYLGAGGGGILNAVLGSLILALPATGLACVIGLAIAVYLQKDFIHSWVAGFVRFCLEILWGIPSIIYGVFCFLIMIYLGMSASVIVGILALTLLEIPIITRYMDESIKLVPLGLKEGAYSLGLTKFETALKVVPRQALPGILAGILLGLGRGIGDAASILFTAGFTNRIPGSIYDSTAALPTMIFQLSTSSLPVVRQKASATALVLLIMVFSISILSRTLSKRYMKHIIK
ncbi:MAG: phosphate ABC transporter permease PstA [Candidatus Thermoplasmatota archaeon]|nr:phosphate ABC transporter permease PstA [Candidatus Thermoplasmatota archaeon]